MKTFKQFISEISQPYRSGYFDGTKNTATYDDEYLEKGEVQKIDDGNKPIGWKHTLKPKRNYVGTPPITPSDDVIHRGISHKEYLDIVKNGRIRSKGRGNIGKEQENLTYFSTDPKTAHGYSKAISPKEPAYIVSIKKPHESMIKKVDGVPEDFVGVTGDIPKEDIVSIHRGKVVSHIPAEKTLSRSGSVSKSAPINRLHWERIK